MNDLRLLTKQNHLTLLITKESTSLESDFNIFQDFTLFLIKYAFVLTDSIQDTNSSKPQFPPPGELFSQNSNGARYLDAKYSRWISVDPALGEYVPAAGKSNEADKLPGMGGIFNSVNLSLYHYAGNNPIKYVDPDGRTEVYFIYVYKTNSAKDQKMKASERNSINDEVKYLQSKGVSVKIIEAGSFDDIKAALEDKEIKMLVTSGHGSKDCYIETADGETFAPYKLEDIDVSDTLKFVIFENCYQGGKDENTNDNEVKWEKAFGGNVDVIGWKDTTTPSESRRFNGWGFFDRQPRNLESYCKEIAGED